MLILCLSQESSRYERNATNRAYANARNAERQIATDCRAGVPRDRPDCVNKAVEAARENQRKEQDLAAQWVTAWWTQVTGSAAVVGVILSAFGIFLVWRTFSATREANKISRQTAHRQLRPYVYFGDTTFSTPLTKRSKINLTVKNQGLSPALNVKLGMERRIVPMPIGEQARNITPANWGDMDSIGPQGEDTIYGSPVLTDEDIEGIKSGKLAVVCVQAIKYEWPTGEDMHQTCIYLDKISAKSGKLMGLNEWARHHAHEDEDDGPEFEYTGGSDHS